jgi:hypothetical protein
MSLATGLTTFTLGPELLARVRQDAHAERRSMSAHLREILTRHYREVDAKAAFGADPAAGHRAV